jgi:uncharacterized C2H2 Zn-finger protein
MIPCQRCNKLFKPQKSYYRYCQDCFKQTQPQGFTHNRPRPGGAARTTGGVSRLRDKRHSVTLRRGHETAADIVAGLNDFLSDVYRQPTGLNQMWRRAGVSDKQIGLLNQQKYLTTFVMHFCPDLLEWLNQTVGHKARILLIEHYGIYGRPRQALTAIIKNYNLDVKNPERYLGWAFQEIRKHNAELVELTASRVSESVGER